MSKFKNSFYLSAFLFFLFATTLFGGLFLLIPGADSANQDTVTVQATVPGCGDGIIGGGEVCDNGVNNGVCPLVCSAVCAVNNCGGGGQPPDPPPPDNPPTINNIVATPDVNTAKITWGAADDKGIKTVVFVYGLTDAYGSNGVVAGNYEVNLAGLAADTTYHYKITVTDTIDQAANSASTFKTKPVVLDNVPPVISNVVATPAITSATITWDTNEDADSQVNFGLNIQYGGTASDAARVKNHSIVLLNLLPNTTYHYRVVSVDASANSANTVDAIFKTNKDAVPPPDVGALQLVVNQNSISLNWNNPNVLDFSGVKVVRKIGARSANAGDGLLVYNGKLENFTDQNVQVNVDYYYTVFSYDTSENHSGGVFKNGKIIPPPPAEVCDNGLDDDGDGKIDCLDPDCVNFGACRVAPPEVCNNGMDDDDDGGIDCADPDCVVFPACILPPGVNPEICNNGLDDDGDGRIDCVDPDCMANPLCLGPGAGPGPGGGPGGALPEICNNGLDDDGDGKIDCVDPDCVAFPGCAVAPLLPGQKPIELAPVPVPNVPVFARINLSDFLFLAANRQIGLGLQGQTISSLAGSDFTVGVPKRILASPPVKIILVTDDGASHQLALNAVADTYFSDIIFPGIGDHQTSLQIDYGNGQLDSVIFNLRGLPMGEIKGKGGARLSGVEITLLSSDGKPVDMSSYGERNPFFTNNNGIYGWVVPNGQYFIQAKQNGYYDRKIPIKISNHIVNNSFSLVAKPPPLNLKIDPNKSVAQNIQNVVGNLTQQVGSISQITTEVVGDVIKDPEVQKTASQVVAPAAVGVVTAGAVSMVSWSSLASFLQFLLFQPLMLFGLKKREKWGQIYNSLTKLPVDLAVVRLLDAKTGRIVQSRVTDTKGRYVLNAKPGEYLITVSKNGFIFPSGLLKGFQSDGKRTDIYHGEAIKVNEEDMILTVNVPLDPAGAGERPKRLLLRKILHRAQSFLSWAGLIITAVAFYISREWYVGVLLAVNLLAIFIFRRLVALKKPKGWGIVYDVGSKLPISRVVTRLFDSQFNKLVATQVTDNKGRYYFLAGGNKYYITYSHEKYIEKKTEIIDTGDKKDDFIALNMPMEKGEKRKN